VQPTRGTPHAKAIVNEQLQPAGGTNNIQHTDHRLS
jgi:hypothetical protein